MKNKKRHHVLIRQSRWRSRFVSAAYFGLLFLTCCIGTLLSSMGEVVCFVGLIILLAAGLATSRELRKQRRYRRDLGDHMVSVPVSAKPKRKTITTKDGQVLEIINDEDAPIDLIDDKDQDKTERN